MLVKKVLYVFARTVSLFGLPVLSKVRNRIYSSYFAAGGMRVSDRVLVTTAHRSSTSGIDIGKNLELGRDAYIDYSGGLVIGNDVAISEGAKVFTHNHVVKTGYSNWHKNPIEFSSLVIEDNVWIGAGAIITPRVKRIGKGAVVAAGAVLTVDAKEHGIYTGNPAVFMKDREVHGD